MQDHLMYVYMQHKFLLIKIIKDKLNILLCCIYVYCKGIQFSEGAVVATETNF